MADSRWLDRALQARRPLVMGILNVTPDSFSDGGCFDAPATALARARAIRDEGADILDIGAESTRPYGDSAPVSAEEEWARLAETLPAAVSFGIPVSVDTMKATVAARALKAGAAMLNDVWGLQRDPDMARVAAEHDVPVVVMHNRDSVDPDIDIMADIERFFERSLEIAARAGLKPERIVLDPGIGFGKTPRQSIIAIARLAELSLFGRPILMGLSRKRFIDAVSPAPPLQRLAGSLAGNLAAVAAGAMIVRVHDVFETVQALKVRGAIESER
ncbi:dihydropteroate synthase [Blastochloris viridis]|uniref:Dihydropteroate synthase n=1 Tax=Blastochloris viridis TaxID=1079 RepID=A0A0H5BBT7_BLAVI|nr:dihydropteroate synthase [Blastochloris viridis]ALK10400.1 Dihydropteroate synthase [Blastochloris viridis]BAR99660.1 dihydropteroate synthase [Blastochloris viridis]CUU43062.1 Dihydropteroate synthase [Blastochloris viridis]